MTTRMRMKEAKNTRLLDSLDEFRRLRSQRADNFAIWKIRYTDTSSDSLSELSAPDNEFDGSGYLYLTSSSANDDYDGGTQDCRKVAVLGFDENNEPVHDNVQLDGTNYVKTNSKFTRVSHIYGSLFGSNDSNAAGDITLETTNTGGGTILHTISAGSIDGNGLRIYVPSGNKYFHLHGKLMNTTNTNNGTTIVKKFISGMGGEYNTEGHFGDVWISNQYYNTSTECNRFIECVGSNTGKIIFKESEMGTTGNETFVFHIDILTYKN